MSIRFRPGVSVDWMHWDRLLGTVHKYQIALATSKRSNYSAWFQTIYKFITGVNTTPRILSPRIQLLGNNGLANCKTQILHAR